MAEKSYPLRSPAAVKAAAERLAREDGVFLKLRIYATAAQKVGAMEFAADFFTCKARDATPGDLLPFLEGAAVEPPALGDELADSSRA